MDTGTAGAGLGRLAGLLPAGQLKKVGRELARTAATRAQKKGTSGVRGLTQMLPDAGDGDGVTAESKAGAKGPGGGGDGGAKVVNIVEQFDVGLPRRAAYGQWTMFADYPTFTRKVESVEQESDEKINWRAQIFLSHRSWESTIVEQVPDERIVWTSKGPKGFVDGAVTFHELAPTMTRVLLVAEYHPDGFFEKTANLWRAQGRRLRLEFKHIKRHMMTRTLLEKDQVEGWRGEIRDGEVVKTHEEALQEEKEQQAEKDRQETEQPQQAEEPQAEEAQGTEEPQQGEEPQEDESRQEDENRQEDDENRQKDEGREE